MWPTPLNIFKDQEKAAGLSQQFYTTSNPGEQWIFWRAGVPFKGPLVSWKCGSNSYQMHEVQESQKPSPETWTGTQCNSAEKDSSACKAEIKYKSADMNYDNIGLY